MEAIRRTELRDWLVAGALGIVALVLRLPFRTAEPYHWDGAQFAVAIDQYSVALSQPHAPGYFLYVMLGRLVNTVLGDPHASLVWISVVCGSLLPALLYLMGARMFGRGAGGVAAVCALTSPQVWFHSVVGVTYALDALLVTGLVWLAWRAMDRGGTWADAIGLGVGVAVIGGVRQQSVLLLGPLLLYVFWQFDRRRFAKLLGAGCVAVVLGLAWFVPMVQQSGGLALYLQIVKLHAANNATVTWSGGGTAALLDNVLRVVSYLVQGLGLGAVVLGGAVGYRLWRWTPARRQAWKNQHGPAMRLLAWWVVPMMLWGTVIGFTSQPGYVMTYLPALLLLTGVAVASVGQGGFPVDLAFGSDRRRRSSALHTHAAEGRPTPFSVQLEGGGPPTPGHQRASDQPPPYPEKDSGWAVRGYSRQRSALALLLVLAVAAVNVAVFLGPGRGSETLTAGELREHDRMIARITHLIRERYDPATTVICHVNSWFMLGLRHLQLRLPEYDQYQLVPDPTVVWPDGRRYWRSTGGRLDYVSELDRLGKTTAVIVAPAGVDLAVCRRWLPVGELELVAAEAGTRLYAVGLDRVVFWRAL